MEKKIGIDKLLIGNLHTDGYILGFYKMYENGYISLEQFASIYEKILDSRNDY